MKIAEWAESRTSRLTVWDLALIKWSCLAGGLLAARLVPSLRRIDTRVLAAIAIALAVKPAVATFSTKTPIR